MRNAIAAVMALLITACSSSSPPAATLAVSSPTPTSQTPAATSAAPTAATASPIVRPSPTPITDVSQAFRPLTTGWRPIGTTLVIARSGVAGDITLVAVALGASGRVGAPTPIVSFSPGTWALRGDGGALAVTVPTGHGGRIAIWEVGSGAARWLTADEPGRSDLTPVWSKDGTSIYYLSTGDDGKTFGFVQLGADGSGKKQLRAAEERTASLDGLTPDGNGLVWTSYGAGGTVEIFDIASGVSRHLENVARVASWRARQPRALLRVGGCCAGRPGGDLVLWDDVAMTSQVVAARGQFGDPAWGSGEWDPTGTRIAAMRFDNTSPYESSLVIIDPVSGASQPIAGTLGAGFVLWLAEGIVFSRQRQPGFELMLLPDGGGVPVSLYQDAGLIQRIDVPR